MNARRGRTGFLLALLLALALDAPSSAAPAKPLTGRIEMRAGRPTMVVDGKPELPMVYALTDFRGGRWTWEEIPRRNLEVFRDLGFRLYQIDVWFEDIWPKNGPLDLALVRKQLRGVLDVHPGAALFLRFHVNAPFWWNEAHPDETVKFADGPIDHRANTPPLQIHHFDTERAERASLASVKWRDDATVRLRELLTRLAQTPEGRSLVGFQPAGGVYGEWHPWGFPAHDPDTSAPMTAYFREWLRKKYGDEQRLRAAWGRSDVTFATAEVPSLAARDKTLAGLFRDPSRERDVMDYYEAQQDTIADDILHFASVVKKTWPRPIIVGTFYGYYFSTFGRQVAGAHLRMNRMFGARDIDYVSAPQSYFGTAHTLGGTGQSRGLAESARLAGKLYLDEMDTGTHLRKPGDGYNPDDPKNGPKFVDDVALLRRNTAHPLMRGMGLWYYDFGAVFGAGHWDHARFRSEIARLREIFVKQAEKPYEPAADVLFVFDTEYLYGFRSRWNTINETLIDRLPALAYRSGVAFDTVRLPDLRSVDLSRYKAVVFANTLQMSEADRRFVDERVARDGRHLVFLYLPGYSDGQRLDERHVVELTGVRQRRYTYPGQVDPKIAIEAPTFPKGSFTLEDPVEPMMVVDDPEAKPIGFLESVGAKALARPVVVAKKVRAASTAWVATLSLHHPGTLRSIFREAGAHVYLDRDDSVLAGNGLLMVHTVEGGKGTLTLRNGRKVELQLAPRSTVLFDATTGESLLPDATVAAR